MNKITQLDSDQIVKYSFDEEHKANRVILVNGLSIDSDKISNSIANSLNESLKKVNFNSNAKSNHPVEIKTIEVPIIVKEYEVIQIEKPVVVFETKIVEIERPIIIEQPKIIEIEKQIVVKEQQIIEIKIPEIIRQYEPIPLWMKVSLVLFLGISILTNIILLIKK